jgi:hypothetical protein
VDLCFRIGKSSSTPSSRRGRGTNKKNVKIDGDGGTIRSLPMTELHADAEDGRIGECLEVLTCQVCVFLVFVGWKILKKYD